MTEKLKVLILVRPFWITYPKHKAKSDTIKAIEQFADVRYWYTNGEIKTILKTLKFQPDFIFHYDIAYGFALSPYITGLNEIDIPKGCLVIDAHFSPPTRTKYIEDAKINLIFSITKETFLKTYPMYDDKFRWWPFSINPSIFKDHQLQKDVDFLLMGQVFDRTGKSPNRTHTYSGKYPFREEVLSQMRDVEGFTYHPHPGHNAGNSSLVNEKYAMQLNRSKIFFTCGSKFQYPVLKFFEAPACKSLLLAEPVNDIADLGFKDGVHYIACDHTNVYEKAMYYINNDKERETVTDAGYRFLHRYHTDEERAKQFVQYLQEYLKIES
ncbi:glycosyltransferase [Priestia filamentosa]|uniref:glycosyltransferase family protein n=1 Tax=Priestia filamentosa TaxID=1402861 RepID=UPI00397B31AB